MMDLWRDVVANLDASTVEDWLDAFALVFFLGLIYGLLQFIHIPT